MRGNRNFIVQSLSSYAIIRSIFLAGFITVTKVILDVLGDDKWNGDLPAQAFSINSQLFVYRYSAREFLGKNLCYKVSILCKG